MWASHPGAADIFHSKVLCSSTSQGPMYFLPESLSGLCLVLSIRLPMEKEKDRTFYRCYREQEREGGKKKKRRNCYCFWTLTPNVFPQRLTFQGDNSFSPAANYKAFTLTEHGGRKTEIKFKMAAHISDGYTCPELCDTSHFLGGWPS